ncbi:MAG: MerR family transcriptional regulator [Candidatus Omnitrophica bacterium]|nr:MerR family transcriptional regulator [Candidatus Omnitrophota bacterium]
MDDFKDIEDFEVDIDPEDPVFVISVVSKLCDIPVWTLRELEKKGVIKPKRLGKKTRCYSKKQIKKLEYIHYLMEDKHVNISGIRVILELTKE